VRERVTERCDRGCLHVVQEKIYCDFCGGLIVTECPRTIDVFGRGISSDVRMIFPSSEGRVFISVEYRPVLQSPKKLQFEFCCMSHVLRFFRDARFGQMGADELAISMPFQALGMVPVCEPAEPAESEGEKEA
jgi:hypothetical protein